MTFELHRHDARHLSDLLEPESVDLIITSPPYYDQRSYRDAGVHIAGQVGSEATPDQFVDALVACTADWLPLMRPSASLFVNLGDKYLGKSLLGIPWRYALRCIDDLGLTLRAELIWSKPNCLPESCTDRVRRSHEQWFHFTRHGDYFAAIDAIREPNRLERPRSEWTAQDRQAARNLARGAIHTQSSYRLAMDGDRRKGNRANPSAGGPGDSTFAYHPLGRVPGSVWSVASEPFVGPNELRVDHFAAFPTELPRRIVLGWAPPTGSVLDPFAGTGTTVAVAHHLGRHGIGTDLSADYLRLAEWRCLHDRTTATKVRERSGLPLLDDPNQLSLFGTDVSHAE